MRRLPALALAALLTATPAAAQLLYDPPEGCKAIATLRLSNCVVRQIARCPAGNIMDTFDEGLFLGRAYYAHPSLFLRYEGASGYVAGHDYGTGTPDRDATLYPGSRYTYTRSVYRSTEGGEPGDEGAETLTVDRSLTASFGGRDYPVLEINFEVKAEGYYYRERALMLREPALTLGVLATTYGADGEETETFSSIPETISLQGDPDFRGFDPAPSCLPSS